MADDDRLTGNQDAATPRLRRGGGNVSNAGGNGIVPRIRAWITNVACPAQSVLTVPVVAFAPVTLKLTLTPRAELA